LDLNLIAPEIPENFYPFHYCNWIEIFRSWFWRYYDHLGRLLLYNFIWFSSFFLVGWIAIHYGWIVTSGDIQVLKIFFLFLIESCVSFVWAYLVFQIFNQNETDFRSAGLSIRNYFFKGITLSTVSGFILFLFFYSIRFYFLLKNLNRTLDYFVISFIFWVALFYFLSALYHWPVLFFQNPTVKNIFFKSFLLVLNNLSISLGGLFFITIISLLFCFAPFLWFFLGFVFFFSFQCVVLEKQFLRYKITYKDKPLIPFLELLDQERKRGWRNLLRPWENR
jgi:hypothetical protein